jgi:hypothetical protein
MENETIEETNGNGKTRRTASLLAAMGLVLITGGAVGGLVYDLTLGDNSEQTLTQIGTIATLGVGGLLALAGARKEQ